MTNEGKLSIGTRRGCELLLDENKEGRRGEEDGNNIVSNEEQRAVIRYECNYLKFLLLP